MPHDFARWRLMTGLSIGWLCASSLFLACPGPGDDYTGDDDTTPGDDDASPGDDDTTHPGDDDDTTPGDEVCASTPAGRAYLVPDYYMPDAPTTGRFTSWAPGISQVQTGEGDLIAFHLEDGGALDLLPDLSAFEELSFMSSGWMTESGAWAEVYFFTGEPPGELVLQIGSNHLEADLGSGWSVAPDEEEPLCDRVAVGECSEYERVTGIRFTHGDESVVVYQGQQAELDGFTIHLQAGVLGEGAYVGDECLTDDLNYFILPAAVDR